MEKGNGHNTEVATQIGGKPLDEAIEVCLDHLRLIKPLLDQRRAQYLATEKLYHTWLRMHSTLDRQRAENSRVIFKRITTSHIRARVDAQIGISMEKITKQLTPEQINELIGRLGKVLHGTAIK